jgi:cytochrome c-type biogenesis protein CcmH/NrfG
VTEHAPSGAAARVQPAFAWAAGVIVVVVAAVMVLRGVTRSPTPVSSEPPAAASAPDSSADGPDVRVDTVASARVAALERRLGRDSSDHAALVELGHAYLASGQLDRATAVNFKAVQLRPRARETAEAYAHLGMILAYQGEDSVGLHAIDEALLLRPDLPEALLFRGMITFSGQDYAGAITAWTRYLEVAPAGADTNHVHALLQAARQMTAPLSRTEGGRVFN